MPSLTTIPREIRDEILAWAILSLDDIPPFPAADHNRVVVLNDFDDHWSKTTAIIAERDPKYRPVRSLLLTNKQIHDETQEIIQRNPDLPGVLDVLLVNGAMPMLPTWRRFPAWKKVIDTVHVLVRSYDGPEEAIYKAFPWMLRRQGGSWRQSGEFLRSWNVVVLLTVYLLGLWDTSMGLQGVPSVHSERISGAVEDGDGGDRSDEVHDNQVEGGGSPVLRGANGDADHDAAQYYELFPGENYADDYSEEASQYICERPLSAAAYSIKNVIVDSLDSEVAKTGLLPDRHTGDSPDFGDDETPPHEEVATGIWSAMDLTDNYPFDLYGDLWASNIGDMEFRVNGRVCESFDGNKRFFDAHSRVLRPDEHRSPASPERVRETRKVLARRREAGLMDQEAYDSAIASIGPQT